MRSTHHRFSFLLRAACKVTAGLFLLFPVSFPASSLSQSASRSVDEEAVRAFTEKYGQAIAAGDLEKMRELWNPQSAHLTARLRIYQNIFSNSRIEFIKMAVTRLEVTGERAVSQLTTDERQLDKKTGVVVTEPTSFTESAGHLNGQDQQRWKVEREFSVQEELAARLEAAASERERDELVEKEKAFVTDAWSTLWPTEVIAISPSRVHMALRCFQLEQAVAKRSATGGHRWGLAELRAEQSAQDDYGRPCCSSRRRSRCMSGRAQARRGLCCLTSSSLSRARRSPAGF